MKQVWLKTFLAAADPKNIVGSTSTPVLLKTNQRDISDTMTAAESSQDFEVRRLPPEQPAPTASLRAQQPPLAADLECLSPANSCPSQPASQSKQSCASQLVVFSEHAKGQCSTDGSVLSPLCPAAREVLIGAYSGKHGWEPQQLRSEHSRVTQCISLRECWHEAVVCLCASSMHIQHTWPTLCIACTGKLGSIHWQNEQLCAIA